MNERIQELAKKSGLLGRKFMFGQYYDDELTDEQKKFAELIVKECAQFLVDKNFCGDEVYAPEELMKHFGVEE